MLIRHHKGMEYAVQINVHVDEQLLFRVRGRGKFSEVLEGARIHVRVVGAVHHGKGEVGIGVLLRTGETRVFKDVRRSLIVVYTGIERDLKSPVRVVVGDVHDGRAGFFVLEKVDCAVQIVRLTDL